MAAQRDGQSNFIEAQRLAQGAYLTRTCPEAGYQGKAYRLPPEYFESNLAPAIRKAAPAYFAEKRIAWHIHASHGLSSQVCCLNFLMPLATRPELLSRILGHALGIDPPKMLAVESGPDGAPWYVGFEWIGDKDYLNESRAGSSRTRGANATSADAIVRFHHNGQIETLLIEWKYTEVYGTPLQNEVRRDGKRTANEVRTDRYCKLVFAPNGPVKNECNLRLEDFFWEPFYQLLRQQMLAFQMQEAHERGSERVRLLHISPMGNNALHSVTSPALRSLGEDAFSVFSETLTTPASFISRTTEQVFGSFLADTPDDPWSAYLSDRYTFLSTGQ